MDVQSSASGQSWVLGSYQWDLVLCPCPLFTQCWDTHVPWRGQTGKHWFGEEPSRGQLVGPPSHMASPPQKSPWATYARSPHSCIVEVGEGFPQFLLRLVKQPKLISKSWVIAFLGFLGRTSPRVAASSEVLLANTSLPSFLQDAILQIPLYKFFTPKAIVYKTFS